MGSIATSGPSGYGMGGGMQLAGGGGGGGGDQLNDSVQTAVRVNLIMLNDRLIHTITTTHPPSSSINTTTTSSSHLL